MCHAKPNRYAYRHLEKPFSLIQIFFGPEDLPGKTSRRQSEIQARARFYVTSPTLCRRHRVVAEVDSSPRDAIFPSGLVRPYRLVIRCSNVRSTRREPENDAPPRPGFRLFLCADINARAFDGNVLSLRSYMSKWTSNKRGSERVFVV